METPTKRRKLNDSTESNNEPHSHTLSGSHPSYSQQSSRFDGQGILNNGHLAATRDIIITHHNNIHEHKEQEDRERQERERRAELRRALLESLRFSQMDARHTSIKKAHAQTCRWFLKDPEYLQWSKDDGSHGQGRFLWIKGKPGAGKSTLMKFLLGHTRRAKSESITLCFFFNARGNEMEKTTLGLYQSLFAQLLELRPNLQSILDRFPKGHDQWSVELLKELFEEAVEGLSEAPVVCFIDALDECQEQEVRDMIVYLSALCDAGNRLQICFASRHYPHITITKGRSIVLENKKEHRQDIASYVDSALRIGTGKLVDEIQSDLQKKSSGVFMWVVLVVDILNKEYDAGRKHGLRARLRQIPGDLHTLFRDILTRDKNNTPGLLLCIQWVLFARQPLTPRQLYFAILSGLESENLAECHTDEIKDDDIARFVLDNSKGLAESTKSTLPTIQFIHESVRDFLLKDNGLQAIWPDAGTKFEGRSHEALKQACLAYIKSEPVACLDLPAARLTAVLEEMNKENLRDINSKLPFLEYANQSILFHADRAGFYSYNQAEFLASFPLRGWIAHHNLFQEYKVQCYTPAVSLLYILAERNYGALIRAQPITQSCFNVENERYGTPLFAALATNSTNSVKALIENQQLVNNVPIQTSDYEDWCGAFSRTFSFSSQRGVLSHLVKAGCENLLKVCCTIEQFDFRSRDKRGWLPISYAVEKGNIGVAKFLIERGADVNSTDSHGLTPLIRALIYGCHSVLNDGTKRIKIKNTDIAKLLIERGADVNTTDSTGSTPLIWASTYGYTGVAKLLIEQGADVNVTHFGWTPLTLASRDGHIDVARLLIERGADVNATGFTNEGPLTRALRDGYTDIAKLLIERGADVNAINSSGSTPLTTALDGGHIDVARLLIERGADIDAAHSSV